MNLGGFRRTFNDFRRIEEDLGGPAMNLAGFRRISNEFRRI